MKKKKATYEEKASQIQKVVELAERVIRKSKKMSEYEKEQMIKWGMQIKELAKNPEPQFRKVASLRYLENDFLTYWNEAEGEDVELFWKKVYSNKLDFRRKDVLASVLKRKRIKDIHEYNTVVDRIVIAEQLGQISQEEAKELSELIGKFEDNTTK